MLIFRNLSYLAFPFQACWVPEWQLLYLAAVSNVPYLPNVSQQRTDPKLPNIQRKNKNKKYENTNRIN